MSSSLPYDISTMACELLASKEASNSQLILNNNQKEGENGMLLDIRNIPKEKFFDIESKILRLLVNEGLEEVETVMIENFDDELEGYCFEIKAK